VIMRTTKRRIAFIVSHPVQYYAPLYQRLAARDDVAIKVFFTWHAGAAPVLDHGFQANIAWDIPLTEGYEYVAVPNISAAPGTHRFLGLRNPGLVRQVTDWHPDVAIVHGWAWLSHLQALRGISRRGVPTLFRGDSHLLDPMPAKWRAPAKRALLTRLFSWPAGFLVVGSANRAYYEAFGVKPGRMHACPHSVDVGRFAHPARALEREAAEWRRRLGIRPEQIVLLYAGKFEPRKRPVELMRAVTRLSDPNAVLLMVGSGELEGDIAAIAAASPDRFRVLPFQNQSRMPLVYRLGDLFVLPSAHGETWGLAVNEALACGRPVLASDRVGCAQDVIDASCGRVFATADAFSLQTFLSELLDDRAGLTEMGKAATTRAWQFDIAVTEDALIRATERVCVNE
jgi:glycosyltransferase involved in cell wall biosynthesis